MMKWSLFIFAAVISNIRGQNFDAWCPNLRNDTRTCANQHLSQLPGIASGFSDPSQIINIQAVVSMTYSTICQPASRTAVENFLGCVYGKLWPCIPADWRKAFPDVDRTKSALNVMCDNINDVDINCTASLDRAQSFGTCLAAGTSRPGDISNPDAFLKYACSLSTKLNPCIDTAYGACPKRTAEVLKMSYAYNVPAACDACISKPSLILIISFLILLFVNKSSYDI